MPTKLTDEQVAEMKAAAELATPGPWGTDDPYVIYSKVAGGVTYLAQTNELDTSERQCKIDAAHIALCDPTTILSILTELTDLRERLGSLSGETNSPPITRLLPDNGKPEWQQIDDLFARYGLAPPSTRLRDELVTHLVWARYGEELASWSLSTTSPAPPSIPRRRPND